MHGAQLQQIHLGFVNYRSELYNQLVYISYTYLQAQSAFRSRGPGEGPRYLVVRNAFLPVSNRGRVTDRVREEFQTPTEIPTAVGFHVACHVSESSVTFRSQGLLSTRSRPRIPSLSFFAPSLPHLQITILFRGSSRQ